MLGIEAVVDQQAVDILDFLNGELPAFEMGDLVTRGEAHAGQRGIARCVLAGFAGGRVEHGEQSAVLGEDGSQTQFRFAVTDPALPRLILRHACLPREKAGYGNGCRAAAKAVTALSLRSSGESVASAGESRG